MAPEDSDDMPDKDKKDQVKEGPLPVITAEVASQLAQEGASLREEVRQRVETMWEIGSDERQARSR